MVNNMVTMMEKQIEFIGPLKVNIDPTTIIVYIYNQYQIPINESNKLNNVSPLLIKDIL